MALGNNGPATDSPVQVITSAIAIAIVFVLIMLLIILRAHQMALRRQEAMRMEEEWEMQLILRFKDKPSMHQVWLSSSNKGPVADTKGKLSLHNSEWDKLMPLFAAEYKAAGLLKTPCEESTYCVGVLLRLPHPRAPTLHRIRQESDNAADTLIASPQDVTPSGSELLFGFSILPVIERPR